MVTWISVVVVVVVIAVILVVYETSTTPKQRTMFGFAPPGVMKDVTQVPTSVFNQVGIDSPTIQVTDIYQLKKQPPLTTTVDGKKVPYVFYWGGEYCPFCAATRWGIIVALSRFGTFTPLRLMFSSSTDVHPNTPTFTFYKASYTSKYFAFNGYEVEDRNKKPLMTTPPPVSAIIAKYNSGGSFPFMDIGNRIFIVGSAYDPGQLAGLTQKGIATQLSNPANPITQAIVTEANYISAGICVTAKNAPASVCQSPGVKAAIGALGQLPD